MMSSTRRSSRRTLGAALAVVLAAATLAGCASDGRESIRFTFNKPEAIAYMTQVVSDFNASQSDIRVVLDTSGVDPLAASFVRGNPPDLALANYNMETSRFVARCALSDLSGTGAAEAVDDSLTPLMDQYGTCEGRTSALPYSIMASAVIYNKQVFTENGVEVPTTWTELLQVCETLKQNGVDPFYGTFKDGWTIGQGWFDFTVGGMVDSLPFFEQLAAEGTEIGPNSAASFQKDALEPVQRMQQLAREYANGDANNRAYNDGNLAFADGKAAMYLQGPWAMVQVSNILEAAGGDAEATFGTFPLPMTESAADNKVRVNVDLAAWIPEASQHKEAARVFLEYLYEPDRIQAYNDSQLGFTPTTAGQAPDDARMQGAFAAYDAGNVYQGASVLVPKTVPIFNYAQILVTQSDPTPTLRTIDADLARLAFRQ